MAHGTDDAQVRHANPATQAGFTMIPMAVMLRGDIPPLAKLVYGYLKHLAWREHVDGIDPPREVIAADLGMNVKQVTVCIRALQNAPVAEGGSEGMSTLVESVRRGQGKTNVYLIHDPVAASDSRKAKSAFQEPSEAKSAVPEKSNRPLPISRGKSEVLEQVMQTAHPLSGDPPAIVRVDGKNLPLDALMEVCGCDYFDDAAVRQATAALNGKKAKGRLVAQGITHLFWIEATRWADAHTVAGMTSMLEQLHAEPAKYAEILAKQIHVKAARYRLELDGAILTPTALAKWWLRLERVNDTQPGGRNLTADEVRARGR